MKLRYLLVPCALFLCGCTTAPEHITVSGVSYRAVTIQCEDEHEPVLTLAANQTVGVITCVKKDTKVVLP